LGVTGLELSAESPVNPHIPNQRGTESGTVAAPDTLKATIDGILALPLDDQTKAEIIRRLVGGGS